MNKINLFKQKEGGGGQKCERKGKARTFEVK
jgi:hypothetical protein